MQLSNIVRPRWSLFSSVAVMCMTLVKKSSSIYFRIRISSLSVFFAVCLPLCCIYLSI